ncbi:MAG: hypothetical protein QM785_13810 [Pyrinomonadaceae bacterium]
MQESVEKLTLHGTLVSINNFGVLLTGESGSGKSECALGLIANGHALIADDVVEILVDMECLSGSAPTKLRGLLSVRNIGILDVVSLFGKHAVSYQAGIDAVVEFTPKALNDDAFQLGAFATTKIGGIELPYFRICSPLTRDLVLLVEAIVKILRNPTSRREINSIESFD